MKKLVLLIAIASVTCGMAQQNFWTAAKTQADNNREALQLRRSNPVEFDLYNLNLSGLESMLNTARKSKVKEAEISFPLPNGDVEAFKVIEHSVFQSGLQAKFPNLRAYKGVSTKDPSTIIYFGVSPQKGVSAMVSSSRFPTYYIDSYTKDNSTYIGYQKNSLPQFDGEFECQLIENNYIPQETQNTSQQRNADDGVLRTYRLALASTGEYSMFHIDAAGEDPLDPFADEDEYKAIVLEEMMISMVRVNGVYERDFAIRMVIIDNNDLIINLNPATDLHENNNGVTMLQTNQIDTDDKIGSANYDIGHIYSTGGGGVAFLGVPCEDGSKAGGVTGLPEPTTDVFWIDFVAHEMGHQFGGNHSYNNSCTNQRNGGTAMEPGSGSTIMAYAGICSPNVQQNSDDHFHAISIQEITNYIFSQSCEVQSPTDNVAPLAIAPEDFTIPASTPFQLDAIAADNDTDSEALTYNWEQMDNEIGEVMPPEPTNTIGPMFRSNSSISSPTRFMPDMPTVLQGLTANTWEVVPSVSRTMEFRITVRDNELNGGATASDDVIVTVDDTAGPFIITSQNTETTWEPNSSQTVTWDVNNTDVAPIAATNMNILFSDDGGASFPFMLAENTENDGEASIQAPNFLTQTGRIKIVPTNNFFFDTNDAPVTIDGTLTVEEDVNFNDVVLYPNPSNGQFTLAFTPNANETIAISLYDIQGRLVNTNTYESDGNFIKELDYSGTSQGIYFIEVQNGEQRITKKIVIQ